MSEPESSAGGPVFRLIYRSHNRIPDRDRKAELGSIFSSARNNNKKVGVTGALLTTGDWFVQALEGDETTVRELFDHIAEDRRHQRVTLVETGEVPERVFGRWSMAQVGEDGQPDIPLIMNRDKGGIIPAAGRPSNDRQDAVLDVMRQSVLGEARTH